MKTIIIIFWVSAFIVFYTYLGYGILLFLLVKIKELLSHTSKMAETHTFEPDTKVTLLIAAYNEEDVIKEKMENCLKLDYPPELFEIVWVTDGSTDHTNLLLECYTLPVEGAPTTRLLYEKERRGKSAAIDRAMKFVDSPIVVFTDANTMINPQAIKIIAEKFQNKKVGCVAGEKRVISGKNDGAVASEGIYWKYESFLKNLDYRLYSAVGAAGELYAIRRELFEEMPSDTLLDDFILSMKIAMKGYIIAYSNKAYALERSSLNIKEEEKRKVRIAAGGLQSIVRLAPLLNIFKYGVLSFQYISHRVLRWSITPVLLFLLLPLNCIIAFGGEINVFYSIILFFQIIFYILALTKIAYIPYYFLFMNVNVIKGFFYLYRKKGKNGIWEKAKRK